jgi:hypothetical protein
MSETYPQGESLRELELDGKTLAEWHRWINTDQETGENNGYLAAPGSRYGRNGDDTAWWAIACVWIAAEANGIDDTDAQMDECQGLAVNDSDMVLARVRNYYYCLPAALKEQLEHYDGDVNLAQSAALGALCGRYSVEFVAGHYTPQFDLPDGYVAGWVGGFAVQKEHPTIYVGCDEEGGISS